MDMTDYLGKKIDLTCADGKKYSGYVFDLLDAEESGIGKECIDLSPLEVMHLIAIPTEDIVKVTVDDRFREFDFKN